MKLRPMPTSPLAMLFACAVPLRVYWVMLRCSFFRYSNACVLAHHLHQAGEDGVAGAARARMRGLDLALVLRVDQVGPALRRRQVLLAQHVLVPAEADRAGVEAADQVAAHGVLPHRPAVQVVEIGRPVGLEQADLGGLEERIAGAAPPQVGLRVGRLGADLRQRLAGGLAHLLHLDAGLRLELLGGELAPALVGRADRGELLALRRGAVGQADAKRQGSEQSPG